MSSPYGGFLVEIHSDGLEKADAGAGNMKRNRIRRKRSKRRRTCVTSLGSTTLVSVDLMQVATMPVRRLTGKPR